MLNRLDQLLRSSTLLDHPSVHSYLLWLLLHEPDEHPIKFCLFTLRRTGSTPPGNVVLTFALHDGFPATRPEPLISLDSRPSNLRNPGLPAPGAPANSLRSRYPLETRKRHKKGKLVVILSGRRVSKRRRYSGMHYFVFRQGRVYGPYSIAQMRRFVSEGRVLLSDFARTEAMPQWQALHTIWSEPTGAPTAWSAPPLAAGRREAVAASVGSVIRGNALTWPFHQRDWFDSIWMTLLWWIPVPIFPLGALVSVGWLIDATRRRSWKATDLLPRSAAFGRILLDGMIVSFFFCIYILIPVTLAWMITSLGTLGLVIPAAQWTWRYLSGEATGDLLQILFSKVLTLVEARAVIFSYLFVAGSLFTAAGIRFVLTRKASSFLRLPACLTLMFQNIGAFLQFLFLAPVVVATVMVADALVAPTGIGIPLLIPFGAAGTWVLTYLFGNLAVKVQARMQAGR
jgi:GYF domain 2